MFLLESRIEQVKRLWRRKSWALRSSPVYSTKRKSLRGHIDPLDSWFRRRAWFCEIGFLLMDTCRSNRISTYGPFPYCRATALASKKVHVCCLDIIHLCLYAAHQPIEQLKSTLVWDAVTMILEKNYANKIPSSILYFPRCQRVSVTIKVLAGLITAPQGFAI